MSGLAATVKTKLGVDRTGHPAIAAAGCSSSIGSVKIHFHGGASWLYNLFDSYVDKRIKETLQDKLCQEISDLINNNAEKALSTFPGGPCLLYLLGEVLFPTIIPKAI